MKTFRLAAASVLLTLGSAMSAAAWDNTTYTTYTYHKTIKVPVKLTCPYGYHVGKIGHSYACVSNYELYKYICPKTGKIRHW